LSLTLAKLSTVKVVLSIRVISQRESFVARVIRRFLTLRNGMDAPILLIGIDVPKWRCE